MVNILYFIFYSTKPDLNEIVKYMCKLPAILSELLSLCDRIDI